MPAVLPLTTSENSDGTSIVLGEGDGLVRRSILPGGIRVLTEVMPAVRSVSIGAWFGVGSRDEVDGHFGSTHFLEHLLFKGTSKRSASDIAEAFDRVGGEANAATGKEHTCYHAHVRDVDLPMATDVICDMVTSALLDARALETERGVILEELAMSEDDPTDVVHEKFASAVFGDHPLGRPIGGTRETIEAVPRDAVVEHYRAHYRSDTLVVTAAGAVDHDALCEQVLNAVAAGGWELDPSAIPRSRRANSHLELSHPGRAINVERIGEQANIVLGCLGLIASSPDRFTLSVLHAILGGGMSSRLFQEVRERRGLAYSVYSYGAGHTDAGSFGLYAGCAPSKVEDVVALLSQEWDRLAADGVTDEELERGIGQLRGGLVLGMEDTGSRMSRLGKAELVFGELIGLEESLNRISAVKAQDVQRLAQDLAARGRSLAIVGPVTQEKADQLLSKASK